MKKGDLQDIAYIINEAAVEIANFDITDEKSDFVKAEGTLQQGEVTNFNNRFYTTDDLAGQIYSPRVRKAVKTGNCKGEAGHPVSKDLIRQQKIDPALEQVWFTKLWMEGPLVKGQFRGCNTPLGEAFNKDLKDGQKPSFSLRALGRMMRSSDGRMQVTGLHFVCYDRVYNPSYDIAYTDHLVTESVDDIKHHINQYSNMDSDMIEYVKKQGNVLGAITEAESIIPITSKDVIDCLLKESYDFNTICEQFNPFYKSITLTEDKKAVQMVDESYNTIVVPIKGYIKQKINDFCNRY